MLDGIADGHAFDNHAVEFGLEGQREAFRDLAQQTLTTDARAYQVQQGNSESVLYGNSATDAAGWINTANPGNSTMFRPPEGAEAFLDFRTAGIPSDLIQQVELDQPRLDPPEPPKPTVEDQNLPNPTPPAPHVEPAGPPQPPPPSPTVPSNPAGGVGQPSPPTPGDAAATPEPPAPPQPQPPTAEPPSPPVPG